MTAGSSAAWAAGEALEERAAAARAIGEAWAGKEGAGLRAPEGAKGVAAVLTRTKTSGAGKRVRELPLFVPKAAFIASPVWLETGYRLWASHGQATGTSWCTARRPTLETSR